jgi:DNA-binding GntR family transcriptional regulator
MRVILGSLDHVSRIVKVFGMVNAVDHFTAHPSVINGCSDLFVEVFGENGRHARSAVGVSSLPGNITVEIEAIVAVPRARQTLTPSVSTRCRPFAFQPCTLALELQHFDDRGTRMENEAAESHAAGAAGLSRNSLSERIYVRLRLALMTGGYESGAKLNIRGLAAHYETSPTPVREAVMQLVREGALELRLGHQPRVPVLTIPQYVKIRETRAPLERLATELAAVNATESLVERLRASHYRFVQAEKDMKWKEALAANQEFHFAIYKASENEILVRVIENLWLLAGPFINNQYPHIRRASSEVHPHLMIIDALSRKSPSEAGELAVRDLREGSYLILEKLKADRGKAPQARNKRVVRSAAP